MFPAKFASWSKIRVIGTLSGAMLAGCQPHGTVPADEKTPESVMNSTEAAGRLVPEASFRVEPGETSGAGYAAVPRGTLATLYKNSWYEGRSGEGFLHLAPGHYLVEEEGSDRWKVAHHLSAYDRESHVPLWVYNPADPTHELRTGPVTLESIGATLFDVLDMESPPWVRAPSLSVDSPTPLRAVIVLVLDALPHRVLDDELERLPQFTALRARSKVYSDAWLGYMSSATTVSHAVIGTGAPPRVTGIPLNHDPVEPGRKREIFRNGDVSPLVVPTVADLHDARHGNRAHVISFSSQSRAAIAMAGHGADRVGGDRDVVAWQAGHTGALETWPQQFLLPEIAGTHDPESFMARQGLTGAQWSPDRLFYSPSTALYCEEIVDQLLDSVPFGSDDVCDLLYFNQKVLDNLGHLAGPQSALYAEGLGTLDGFIGRFVDGLHRRLGNNFLMILTSDHGFGPARNPGHAHLHQRSELQARINAAFPSPAGDVVRNIRDLNLFFDPEALRAGGYDIETVCRWMESEFPWVIDALPLSEIQGRASRPS